jgi:protein-L-isoaspartate(D-aspartate) O-methyltransferase
MNDTTTAAQRAALADTLRSQHLVRTPRVEHAVRAVPRHVFLPDVPFAEAYADQVVVTKRDERGAALVSASQPSMVATMLEQLDLQPGQRVLEIGAGTGYNAALLRELVGPDGQVCTVDIDPQAAEQAAARLADAGYPDVHVLAGDGALGDKLHAPYDRIIVTAGAWDLPPAWWEQLATAGRIVVPLRWRGLTRSVALDRAGDRLVSRAMTMCGFIPMRGSNGERGVNLCEDVTLAYDEDQPVDPAALRGVLDRSRTECWSGVTVAPAEPFDGVWLRLSVTEPGTCRIAAQPSAVAAGRATPAIPGLNPAVAEADSLAYFALRHLPGPDRRAELGAIGHGPRGLRLAERILEQLRTWNADRSATPTLAAVPAGTPGRQLPTGHVIDKRHTRLIFTW